MTISVCIRMQIGVFKKAEVESSRVPNIATGNFKLYRNKELKDQYWPLYLIPFLSHSLYYQKLLTQYYPK